MLKTKSNQTKIRELDIDWLRVIGTLIIFFYHIARFFNLSDWHVKNNELSSLFHFFVIFTGQWIMPLFFALSAVSIYHALNHREWWQFIIERFKRLVIPLIVGSTVVLIPAQVYIERISHGDFSGSFIDFYPYYFKGLYAFGGNFAWMGLHLWYLEILFIFSMITLPFFLILKWHKVQQIVKMMVSWVCFPFGFLLPFLMLVPSEILMNQHLDTFGIRKFGGWALSTYLSIFIISYLLFTHRLFRKQLEKYRHFSLFFGLIVYTIGYFQFKSGFQESFVPYSFLRSLNCWVWLCAIFGFAKHHLSNNDSYLTYSCQAVMPFYVLHQTFIVVIGYFLSTMSLPIVVKFVVLALSAFTLIMICFETLIKKNRVLRVVFGMKGMHNG